MSGRLAELGGRAKTRSSAEVARARGLVDHQRRRRPAVDVGMSLYERDGEVAGTVISSAIAFRLFLFFVPLLLFGIGLASQLAQWVDAEGALDAGRVEGSLRGEIRSALAQPGHTRWVAMALGLFGMATAGRTLSKTAIAASSLAWRLPVRSKAPTRVVGSLIGLIATIGLVAVVINRVRADLGVAVAGVSFAAALVVYLLAWMFLLALLPRSTPDPGAVLPGALLIAAVTALLQLVSQLYLPGKIAEASDLYGTFGAAVVALGWLFALGRAMVVGMVLNAVLYERFGSVSTFFFDLPLLRALPRRYASVRRYFGLEEPDHPDRMMPGATVQADDLSTDTKGGPAMSDVAIDAHGPIDFVLIEFRADDPADAAAAALLDLVDAGTIRLLDLAVIRKSGDGEISGLEVSQNPDGTLGGFSAFAGARSGLLGDDDLHEAAGALEPGTAAALIIYENAWAAPFISAARRLGGEVVASDRLPADVVLQALDAIEQAA